MVEPAANESPDTAGVDAAGMVEHYDRVAYGSIFEEFFDHTGFANFGYWENDTATGRQAAENLVEQLLGMLEHKRGTILDVACGKGATTRHLLRYYDPKDVTGINISDKQLETARGAAPGCTFRRMDATKLEFPDDTFDNILCVEAAFHFDTRERFLREALRVLKPGGTLVLSDILVTREAERTSPYRTERNYLEGLDAYRGLLAAAGYSNARVVDATDRCWKPYFRHIVAFLHERFLDGRIDEETLRQRLHNNYQRVAVLRHYALVAATKPAP